MVKVLGEQYTLDDQEDMTKKQITKLWIFNARYRIEVQQAKGSKTEL